MAAEAPKGQAIGLADHIAYSADAVVSKTLLNKPTGTLTLFAFDQGQGLSEHTAPFDASVVVLDGAARLVIGGGEVRAAAGDLVVMPANVPHSVHADQRFKMLLVMIRS